MEKNINVTRLATSALVPLWIIAAAKLYELSVVGTAIDDAGGGAHRPSSTFWWIGLPLLVALGGLVLSGASTYIVQANDEALERDAAHRAKTKQELEERDARRREELSEARRDRELRDRQG